MLKGATCPDSTEEVFEDKINALNWRGLLTCCWSYSWRNPEEKQLAFGGNKFGEYGYHFTKVGTKYHANFTE